MGWFHWERRERSTTWDIEVLLPKSVGVLAGNAPFRVVVGYRWGVRRNGCPDKTRVDIRVTACNHTCVGSNVRTERKTEIRVRSSLSISSRPALRPSVSACSRSVSSLPSVLADVARDRYGSAVCFTMTDATTMHSTRRAPS